MTEPHRHEIELRCAPDGRCDEHVVALVSAGQQALHQTDCPDQGRALLEHAQQLHAEHMAAWTDPRQRT